MFLPCGDNVMNVHEYLELHVMCIYCVCLSTYMYMYMYSVGLNHCHTCIQVHCGILSNKLRIKFLPQQ